MIGHGVDKVVDNTQKTEQQELVEDLVQIITVFSCKPQGKRASKARAMIKGLAEYDKDDKGNASAKQRTAHKAV